ncbi:MAG: glutamyl-tRNA reductase [Nocardioides sp.]|uniref:glutamyl-tRNA reductase n=1 Tax=Nocardioides sp. TaxID=35761 RepID=UPI003F0D55A9
MSVLVVGISHKTAPVALLEQLALDRDDARKLLADAVDSEYVTEAAVIATCNRLEIYTSVDRFHGTVEEISRLVLRQATGPLEALLPHLYVHYDDGAVSHLFQVASGLDSMVVGEGQILGQVRTGLRVGQEEGTVGASLNTLFQQALRVGKRTHAETDIDSAAPSLVTAALAHAVGGEGVRGRRVVIVGAGSMASLATATATRQGAASVVVVNRTRANADRLAREYGVRAADLADLGAEIASADVLITCAGARGLLVTAEMVTAARPSDAGELHVIDLALPHDVAPEVATLPGVSLTGLERLAHELQETDGARNVADVRRIVAAEISDFTRARRQAKVTPTVVALRSMASDVVDAEMERLTSRVPGLDEDVAAEVLNTVRRVADKLLHQPTVRVKELADTTAVSYADALAELFSLSSDTVEAVTRPLGGDLDD